MSSDCADAGLSHQRPSLPGAILVRTVVPVPPPIAAAGGERVAIEELLSSNRATPTSTPRGSHSHSHENAADGEGEGDDEKAEVDRRTPPSVFSGRFATAPPAGTRFLRVYSKRESALGSLTGARLSLSPILTNFKIYQSKDV